MVPLEVLDGQRVKVLIVEDEFFIREDLADQLRGLGFEVIETASADDALQYIGSGERIDVLVTDIQMPGDLDGLALAERLRAEQPMLPIVVASGNVALESVASRVGKFVSKPYDPKRIGKLIAEILGMTL
ncbi:response regulator [Bradyrhizobium sp. 197]|uniref:response regulator n=1 Tax=unclassified Bradyrhizobium TaxID=2631580 RepID=UPI001FF8A8BA|nr:MULTISPECIES: response regulator [unclassified Bradyrhizobium]MCK1405211.1 response regulator [Bradyrhizobium sp. 76]MCK1480699.1 response regulator [Bradyrhizobium sp. 197]